MKQAVEDWGDDHGLSAPEQIALHLEERFDVKKIHIESIRASEKSLMITTMTDRWDEPREFALLPSGSLVW